MNSEKLKICAFLTLLLNTSLNLEIWQQVRQNAFVAREEMLLAKGQQKDDLNDWKKEMHR